MPRKAAALVRVSSKQQARDTKHSIPVQLASIGEYAGRNGFEIEEQYVDALSGVKERRDNFFRLLSDAEEYEAVIIYHTDRLGRSEELSHKFLRLLFESGLEVHSVHRGGVVEEGLATSAEIMISAEERRNIIRRTQAARMAMASKGKLATGIRTFGYRNAGGGAVIYPAEAATVRYIFEVAAERKTHYAIAAELNRRGTPTYSAIKNPEAGSAWTKQTVGQMIRSETYKGTYRWSRFVLKVPPIVSAELWERAQPPRRGPRPTLGFPLLGHIRCGLCGRRMSGRVRRKVSGVTEYYRCNGHGLNNGCHAPELRRDYIEPLTETLVRETLENPELLAALLGSAPQQDDGVAKQLAEIAEEDERWLEAFRLGAITPAELGAYRQALASRRKALEAPKEPLAPKLPEADTALRDAPVPEIMEAFGIAVIAGKETCRLALEP